MLFQYHPHNLILFITSSANQFPKTNELSGTLVVPWLKERVIWNEVHSGIEKYCPQMASGKHVVANFPFVHASSMMALRSCHIHKDRQ